MTNLPISPLDADDATRQPFWLENFLKVGKYLGWAWVPDNHVQVVYRNSRYDRVLKPDKKGLVHHNPLTEKLGPLVFVGPITNEYSFEGLLTRDVLPVKIKVYALFRFDPDRVATKDIAKVLVELPRQVFIDIAQTYYSWVLAALVNAHTATEITQQENRLLIENTMAERLKQEMAFVGIEPVGRQRIMAIELPKTMAERQAQIAQRRENILAGAEFHPAEYRRALVTEVIESLSKTGVGDSFINFPEMLESYVADRRPPSRIIDASAKKEPKSDADEPVKQSPPKPRPKSRLID